MTKIPNKMGLACSPCLFPEPWLMAIRAILATVEAARLRKKRFAKSPGNGVMSNLE